MRSAHEAAERTIWGRRARAAGGVPVAAHGPLVDLEQLGDLRRGAPATEPLRRLDALAPRDAQRRRRREACGLERGPPRPEPANDERVVGPARVLALRLLRPVEREAAGPSSDGRPVVTARRPAGLATRRLKRVDNPFVRPLAPAALDAPRTRRPFDLAPRTTN